MFQYSTKCYKAGKNGLALLEVVRSARHYLSSIQKSSVVGLIFREVKPREGCCVSVFRSGGTCGHLLIVSYGSGTLSLPRHA